jgi:hypothetical protein
MRICHARRVGNRRGRPEQGASPRGEGETWATSDAKDFSPSHAGQLAKFVRELNAESADVEIDKLVDGDFDLDRF